MPFFPTPRLSTLYKIIAKKMELKKAYLEDLLALQAICIKAYSSHFADHWIDNGLALHLEYQYGRKRLVAELADKEIDFFFIQENQVNIGFLKLNLQSSTDFSTIDNCELEKIYILPNYKGMGIGKMALSKVIQYVRTKGKPLLFLCVIESNTNAIGFYKKLGFKFHSKIQIDVPYFREDLKILDRMFLKL